MNKETRIVLAGFFAVSALLLGLMVTLPAWLILLFVLMKACVVPSWAWALYWCYVPASLFGATCGAIASTIRPKE